MSETTRTRRGPEAVYSKIYDLHSVLSTAGVVEYVGVVGGDERATSGAEARLSESGDKKSSKSKNSFFVDSCLVPDNYHGLAQNFLNSHVSSHLNRA
jgi:hypothetical protein